MHIRKYNSEVPAPVSPGPMGENNQATSSFVGVLVRRKRTILVFALVCGFLAFAASAPRTRIYRAHTVLEFAGLNDNVLNTRDVDPSSTGDNSSQAYINTQARVLESIPLLERVATKVKQRAQTSGSAHQAKAVRYLTARGLYANLDVRPGENSKLIDVYVDSPDPDVAADLANTLATEYMSLNLEARIKSTKETATWLNQQVDEARQKLERSESALQAYARKSNLVFTHEDGSVAEARLRELQDDYSKAQADRVSKQALYEGVLAEKPEAVNAALRDSTLQDYQVKLSELNRQMADLSTTYQPANQKVQRLNSQIQELKRDYDRQHDTALTRLRNDFDTAKRREDMLQKAYLSQEGAVTSEASTAVDYNILKREAETNRSIYEAMLQKVRSYGIVSALQPSNIRVIDPAEVPLYPYKPNVPLITVFGLMGGAFLGLAWIGVRDRGEVNVECPGQTYSILQARELGVVPTASLDPYLNIGRTKQLAVSPSPANSRNSLVQRLETASWFCKSSLMAESIRSIRTSLLAKDQSRYGIRTIVVTSLSPGHGKTSVLSNLGISYAELGKSVLLIDADVRNPNLHRIFGLSNAQGLLDLLNDGDFKSPAENAEMFQPTKIPHLSLLSSGLWGKTISASSMFHSERMRELLEYARRSYDLILIDTPPLTLADARILGPLADGVILVLKAGDVRMDSVQATEERLTEDGCRLLGTVLNKWDPRSNGNGNYPERYHKSVYFQAV